MVLRARADYPDHMTDIFDVIADGTRRDILQLLLRRATEGDAGTSVSQIVCELAICQPTVSKHLKVLRDAGLLTSQRRASWVYYAVIPAALRELSALLDPDTLVPA